MLSFHNHELSSFLHKSNGQITLLNIRTKSEKFKILLCPIHLSLYYVTFEERTMYIRTFKLMYI